MAVPFTLPDSLAPFEYGGLSTTFLYPSLKEDDASERNQQALFYFRHAMSRNYDRSQRVDLLNKALELVPGFREALFWRGILHFDTVTHNIEDLRQVLSKTATDSSQYYVAMSQISAMSRMPEQAVEYLTKALDFATNDGDRGEAHYFRAFANWWTDQDEAAVDDCLKTAQYGYNVRSAHSHLADIYKFLKRPAPEIEEQYQAALSPTPNVTELVNYAVYLRRCGKKTEALFQIKKAIAINDRSADAWEEYSYLGPASSLLQNLKTVLSLDTHARLVQCRRMYAAVLADSNRVQEAVASLTEGLAIRPRASLYCLRGQLLLEKRESAQQGMRDIREALRLNPCDADAQYWLGKALQDHEQTVDDAKESAVRMQNALFLQREHHLIEKEDREALLDVPQLTFTFYPGETRGLMENFRNGAVYQYVGTTRRTVHLLATCQEDDAKFQLLSENWQHIFRWLEDPSEEVRQLAKESLRSLWGVTPTADLVKHNRNIIKSLQPNGKRCDLTITDATGQSTLLVHRAALWNECPMLTNIITKAKAHQQVTIPDVSRVGINILVAYLYRGPFTATADDWEAFKVVAAGWELTQLHDTISHVLSSLITPNDAILDPSTTISIDFSTISKDFAGLALQSSLSDVEFVLEGKSLGSRQPICESHKAILGSQCTYFDAMFSTGLRESSQSQVIVSNLNGIALREVVQFCYGAEVTFTEENWMDIFELSDKYGLSDLKLMCALFVAQFIDEENVDDIKNVAQVFNCGPLVAYCNSYKDLA